VLRVVIFYERGTTFVGSASPSTHVRARSSEGGPTMHRGRADVQRSIDLLSAPKAYPQSSDSTAATGINPAGVAGEDHHVSVRASTAAARGGNASVKTRASTGALVSIGAAVNSDSVATSGRMLPKSPAVDSLSKVFHHHYRLTSRECSS